MRIFSAFLFALVSFDVAADTSKEIQHLLKHIESTDCQYERNGDMHSGIEATQHIQKKYDYYFDDIETAEDFIEYSATKSTLSGQQYKIHCDNQATITSKAWLLSELARFRLSTH